MRDKMILNNRKLVYKIANQLCSNYSELEDFISIGMIGLIKAVDRYDSSYGTTFSTYAVPVITNEIFMSLRSARRRAKIPTVSTYETMHNNLTVADLIPDVTVNIAKTAEAICMLREYPKYLTEVEAAIIAMKIDGSTQREIAKHIGLSQGHISRILTRAQEKLKVAYCLDAS